MTNEPKKLIGVELLRHAKNLLDAFEAGKTTQIYYIAAKVWADLESPTFDNEPLYNYRVKPKKVVAYLNLYTGGGAFLHYDRSTADRTFAIGRIACIRVEFEEGQFDD